jgi:hypothetical protein
MTVILIDVIIFSYETKILKVAGYSQNRSKMACLKGGVDSIDFQLFYILIRIIPAVGTLLS